MEQVLARAMLAAFLCAAASAAIVAAYGLVGSGRISGEGVLVAVVCSLLISFPVSVRMRLQRARLSRALAELTAAHEQLADTHAELAEAHARLSEKARHDDMTGLLNRESFFAALKKTRRRTDTGALLIVDADNFKYINDTHGHQQGDAALMLISDAIRNSVRDGDLVGRIGGEEFAAFVAGASEEEALLVAERMRLAVEALRFSPGDGKYLPLSVSIGAARLRPHVSWSEMMREADRRLYEAKRRGRNRVVFEKMAHAAA